MSNIDIIRAWKDENYRNSLSDEQRSQLPENPAGFIELSDREMSVLAGGGNTGTGTGVDCVCACDKNTGTGTSAGNCSCQCSAFECDITMSFSSFSSVMSME
jgi:mersacidin/lichenicidin family type 2 lantibiotic